MKDFVVLLALLSVVHSWDDFFHPPTSEHPLGGGIKLSVLPKGSRRFDIVKKTADIPKVWLRKKLAQGSTSKFDDSKSSSEKLISKNQSKETTPLLTGIWGRLPPATHSLVFVTMALVGLTVKRFLTWQEGDLTQTATKEDGESSIGPKQEGESAFMRWSRKESTRKTVLKMQKDQEECWRVLHTIYKKHASLENSVETLNQKQSGDLKLMLGGTEELSRHVAVLEARMKDMMISLPDSISADITEIREILSTCASKQELEAMAKLLKNFVENLKEVLM